MPVSNPTVSVAIAAFNGAAFIGAQLASIAAQTYPPAEVVVSDDGSTDETAAIVRKFAAKVPFRVRLLQQERNLGILENFYVAFAACLGEVIFYCDQDDIWRREKIARQLGAIAQGAVLVLHPSEIVDAALISSGRSEPVNHVTGYLRAPVDFSALYGFGHQMAFRRSVLELMERVRPLAERLARTGLALNFDRYIPFCASLIGPVAILTEPLTLFRRHAFATSQAGCSASASPIALGTRAAAAIARDRTVVDDAREIINEAAKAGLLEIAAAAQYEAALARKMARLNFQAEIGSAQGVRRWLALPGALAASAQPTGFSNDMRGRAIKVSLAAALG